MAAKISGFAQQEFGFANTSDIEAAHRAVWQLLAAHETANSLPATNNPVQAAMNLLDSLGVNPIYRQAFAQKFADHHHAYALGRR